MDVRPATPEELAPVMTVFDSAQLAVGDESARRAFTNDRVLVAYDADRILGALMLIPLETDSAAEIVAVAVRPGRRNQGIGTALVRAAGSRYDRLVARFDAPVRPFWASLGFEISPAETAERYEGRLEPTASAGR